MRGGGLGGAASGASDIVDGANPVMHCGTAASKPNVKNNHSHGVSLQRKVSVFTSGPPVLLLQVGEETNSHHMTCEGGDTTASQPLATPPFNAGIGS